MPSSSKKEWFTVLSIALLAHLAAAVAWWWTPTVEPQEAGASSMRLALAPSTAPTEDQAETQVVEEQESLPPEPEPVVEPVKPPVEPVVPTKPVEPRPAVTEEPLEAPRAAPQSSAASSVSDTPTPTQQTGNAAAQVGTSNATVEADYFARLASWLARHKRYPRAARRRNLEGVAELTFVLNARGQVLTREVSETSGYAVLDREVIAMLERAQPLPRFPSSFGPSSREIVIPVRFELERD